MCLEPELYWDGRRRFGGSRTRGEVRMGKGGGVWGGGGGGRNIRRRGGGGGVREGEGGWKEAGKGNE